MSGVISLSQKTNQSGPVVNPHAILLKNTTSRRHIAGEIAAKTPDRLYFGVARALLVSRDIMGMSKPGNSILSEAANHMLRLLRLNSLKYRDLVAHWRKIFRIAESKIYVMTAQSGVRCHGLMVWLMPNC